MAGETQDLRFLKALVIGLGVLVAIGTLLVAGVVVTRIYEASSRQSPEGISITGSYNVPLQVPAGSKILGIAATRDRLGVWVNKGDTNTIIIVNPKSGKVAGRILLEPKDSAPAP